MDIHLFMIAFGLMMFGTLYLLLGGEIRILPVVKAGKVTKFCYRNTLFLGKTPSSIMVDGKKVDIKNDVVLFVRGNSMKDYHISDGQRVVVKRIDDDKKESILTHPVLVFSIINKRKENDADYKLRKFVSYVQGNNWSDLYNRLKTRIKIDEERFTSECETKYGKINGNEHKRLVLSETFDEEACRVHYSLHPVSSIFGKVEYVLD